MRKAIDTAPRNGDFVILEDDASGAYTVARWSAEAAQWLDDEGEPAQFNPTHWHSPQTIAELVSEIETLEDPDIPSDEDASGDATAQAQHAPSQEGPLNAGAGFVGTTGQGGGGILSACAAASNWVVRRRLDILAMAACLLAGAAIGPLLYRGDPARLVLPGTVASENETELKHALRQEQELTTKLASDATAARREAESQAALLHQAGETANREKEAGDRTIAELRQALQLELAKTEKLAGELSEAQHGAARVETDRERIAGELRQALKQQEDKAAQANASAADQVALKQERDKTEKLRVELAAARREGESQAALLRAAGEEAARLKEASGRATDELRQALKQAQDKADKLAGELVAARQEVEAKTAAAQAASDQVRRSMEANKRSTDEQGQALRGAQDKAEKLAAESAAARQEADEQRRALQQERDRTEKLSATLADARSSLETQAKAKAAEEVARDNQLAAVRDELQKAKAEATVARESLEAERARTPRPEQQLATAQPGTADRTNRSPAAAALAVHQPSTAPTSKPEAPAKPAAGAEPGNAQAVRLIARANLLLEQGNIGAARNMLDRAAEMGSTEALFWLAETYDPLILSARQTFGTQSDTAKARELYGKALAGGVSEARVRLEALQQRTGAR